MGPTHKRVHGAVLMLNTDGERARKAPGTPPLCASEEQPGLEEDWDCRWQVTTQHRGTNGMEGSLLDRAGASWKEVRRRGAERAGATHGPARPLVHCLPPGGIVVTACKAHTRPFPPASSQLLLLPLPLSSSVPQDAAARPPGPVCPGMRRCRSMQHQWAHGAVAGASPPAPGAMERLAGRQPVASARRPAAASHPAAAGSPGLGI